MSRSWERALVTGASSGIGREIAVELARRGTDLVLVARRRSMLEDLARTVEGDHGVHVELLTADLTSRDGLDAVEQRLGAEDGAVDLLVNNAGFGTFGTFHKLPVEREEEEIRLNVLALVRLSHAALRAMTPRRRGGILNVSSTAGFQPMPYSATYSSTKAFVTTFSEALHMEAARAGVHVSALCPGYVRTEFQDVAEVSVSAIPSFAWLDVRDVARLGVDAVTRNQPVAITGAAYRMLIQIGRFMPRRALRGLVAAVARRRIGH